MNKELAANTNLSHYRIVEKIGAGGMGEVYRARDLRLDREVAVKLLPAEFAGDEDRLRRFELEARATGALNHPNILTIYDFGEHEGAPFIVAELLEGEELRSALDEGAIPLRKAVEYAQQIVSGLSVAHGKGVVHRDLKPENLFITSEDRVKILDFGLAKLREKNNDAHGSEDVTRKAMTDPGAVMGTAGYMSPEQVRGAAADHRSDIFSFGAILFEMLTGKRAFEGDSVVEMMHSVLKTEVPDFDGDNQKVPPALDKLMRRCLEKKPEHRFHSTHDLCFALEALSAPTSSSGNSLTTTANALIDEKTKPSARQSRLAWVVAGALALALLALGAMYFSKNSSNETRAARLYFVPPPELAFNDVLPDTAVISPDGQKIAFTAISADGKSNLYVRNLDSTEAKLLPGSDNAIEPFWSPDSRSVAYGSKGKLKRSDFSGGNAQVLGDAARLVGGTWNKDGVILFSPDFRAGLLQVPAQGGEPRAATVTATDNPNEQHRNPYFLPDGRRFLFRINLGNESGSIWTGSLDSPEIKQVLPDSSPFVYAPEGYLIFVRNDALVAQIFDADKMSLSGEPIPIITGQTNELGFQRRFSVSDNGVLLWQGAWLRDYQLVWFDREGKQTGTLDAPVKVRTGQEPHLSPDGKRLVVKRDNNLWAIDLEKATGLRITSTFSQTPVWSPDGSRIAYNANGVIVKAANGLGDAGNLLPGANFPDSWSPDGRFIFFRRRGVKTQLDIYALPTFGEKKEILLINTPSDERNAQISPDGRWLAYSSDETGSYEIYVQSFSADGKLGADKKRVSTTGGKLPVWRRDGSELFFVAADNSLVSAAVRTGGTEFEFAAPKPLFKTRMLGWIGNAHEYDVSPDGQKFIIGTFIGDTKTAPPTVILNWTANLKK